MVSTVRPNLNAIAEVPQRLHGATASTGFCVLRPDERSLTGRYLFHWVRSDVFIRGMERLATGANYPAVSDRIIKGSDIPRPDIPEQKRIAAILDKADAIRRKRQQAIDLADQLLRSAFLDMFGDPVTNGRGWPVVELRDLAVVTTGNTPSRKNPANFGRHTEWLKSDNINTSSHWLTEASEYLSEQGRKVGRVARAGSTLVTCIAGTQSCVGNAAYADREVAFNQQINALTARPGVAPLFL